MELTEKWARDRKGRMVSRCKTGKVLITKNSKREKPYRVYIAGGSKGSYNELFGVLDRIEGLEK